MTSLAAYYAHAYGPTQFSETFLGGTNLLLLQQALHVTVNTPRFGTAYNTLARRGALSGGPEVIAIEFTDGLLSSLLLFARDNAEVQLTDSSILPLMNRKFVVQIGGALRADLSGDKRATRHRTRPPAPPSSMPRPTIVSRRRAPVDISTYATHPIRRGAVGPGRSTAAPW
jgi:hypothetical protein